MRLEWVFVAIFAFISAVFLWEVGRQGERFMETIVLFSQALRERDGQINDLTSRIQSLEKERSLYRRVEEIERQLRIFCVDGKTAFCANLSEIRK